MKSYSEKIEFLRKEITTSIITILKNNNLQQIDIAAEIESPAYVVYFDDESGHDCKVQTVYHKDGQLSLFVVSDGAYVNAYINSYDLGVKNLDWLENIRRNILSTLELKYKRICHECGKPMDEGYCIDAGMEYYCSDKCLHENYTPRQWLEIYAEGNNESYWTKWEGDSNLWEEGTNN